MIDLTGAYTALITPFTEDGSAIDFDAFARNLNIQAEGGVQGVVPCGTTGETPTLSADEYRAVVENTRKLAKPMDLTVIAGAGSNSTRHAIELHRFVQSAGADAALHVTPYYNKPSQAGLCQHFRAIADSCDLPIVMYNIPGRTGVALSIDTIEHLADHQNIIAIKEATGSIDLAAQIADRTDLTILSGDDPLTLPLATIGASGVVSVISNILPARVNAICSAFLNGDWEEAKVLHAELLPLARALLKLDTNPVPLKTAMQLVGRDTGAVRLPLCRAGEETIRYLRDLLGAYDLQPLEVSA